MVGGVSGLMIRFKLGKSKRLAPFLCVLLLTLETVAFPLTQAKAAATAALATVGFGVTTAAFLAACGIYPYWVDDSSAIDFDWGEWVDDDLMALVNEYNAANSTTPINPNQISAFLSGATLLVGNYAWQKLCNFAEWIKTKYAVADNQMGVELGEFALDGFLSVEAVYPDRPSMSQLTYTGQYVGTLGTKSIYIGASVPDVYFALAGNYNMVFVSDFSFVGYRAIAGSSGVSGTFTSSLINGYSEPFYAQNNVSDGTPFLTSPVADIPVYKDLSALYVAFAGSTVALVGVTADTTTVSIPSALPSGTEYGGLRVSGLPAATTAESVTDAVQDSVGERLKTPVEVVEVELAPGTEIDSETGAITQNPVVIEAPVEETIPALSVLVPAQEFLSVLSEAMQTKFPFCLPFDFMRVLQAFAKSPDAPVITMTFFDRIGGGDYTVTVDLSPWDDVAAVVRRLESMILFLGFWLNFDKFNVLNIILGQIG